MKVRDCPSGRHSLPYTRSAFQGQTPDEMYFGTGQHIPQQLQKARLAARRKRLETNRALSCQTCENLVSVGS